MSRRIWAAAADGARRSRHLQLRDSCDPAVAGPNRSARPSAAPSTGPNAADAKSPRDLAWLKARGQEPGGLRRSPTHPRGRAGTARDPHTRRSTAPPRKSQPGAGILCQRSESQTNQPAPSHAATCCRTANSGGGSRAPTRADSRRRWAPSRILARRREGLRESRGARCRPASGSRVCAASSHGASSPCQRTETTSPPLPCWPCRAPGVGRPRVRAW